MSKHLLLFFFFLNTFTANSSFLKKDELDNLYSLTKTDLDSAYSYSYALLKECKKEEDFFGLVKINYLLGFLHKKDDNIGKSVLHYLEAIRYTNDANYEGLRNDAIDIRQNLANLYRIYKAHDLAIKYYQEAIEIADWLEHKEKLISLKFNLALTFEQNDQEPQAITMFNEILNISSSERKYRIINELGLIYWQTGELEIAKNYFDKLTHLQNQFEIYRAKALHNLGEIEFELGDSVESIKLLKESIKIKEEINDPDKRSLFISYKTLGDFQFNLGKHTEALNAFTKAETLIHTVKNESFSFELFRSLSQLNYELSKPDNARFYSELYSKTVDNYLLSQQKILETDRQYNMDLITKRYFDEVDKQERIASILFYSKLTSGSLLSILLLVVGYNRYERIRLRKSISRELAAYRLID